MRSAPPRLRRKKPRKVDDFEKFYNRTLRFLSYRPRSIKEITDFLKKKKVQPPVVTKILKKLKELDLVNDKEFARWWVEQRTTFRPKGIYSIKQELKIKGISEDLIEKIISNEQFLISNKDAARKLVEKEASRYKGFSKQEKYQKLSQFLARRGFDWETIKTTVDEVLRK